MSILEEFDSSYTWVNFEEGKRIRLFHGSKGGIEGAVSPFRSRKLCDFGQGFYLGTKESQAKGLVCTYPAPKFYTTILDPCGLRILQLNGISWMLAVGCSRGVIPQNKYPHVYSIVEELLNSADVVCGLIADDEMYPSLRIFCDGLISDTTLIKCLSAIPFGNQYALKTEKACVALHLTNCIHLGENEIERLLAFKHRQREESKKFAREIIAEDYGQGRQIQKIIDPLEEEILRESTNFRPSM